MASRSRDSFITVRSEGAILPPDLLRRIVDGGPGLAGLKPTDYHLVPGERLNEAINRSWSRLLGAWAGFRGALAKLPPNEAATGPTRERWLLPLFQELGYGRLRAAKAIEQNGKSYALSHGWGHAPIHLVGCRIDLDRRSAGVAGAARSSPHSLLQELLNGSDEHLWGFVANGLRLRILRDNVRLTRQAYVEFDLEAMFEGQVYADFVLLWLVCHQSRVESERSEQCWLERWSRAAQEQGTRALEQLRGGVEAAITALGCGFLAHPANRDLRERLRSGDLDKQDYYRQLLRLVYRLLFLFVAEDRELLLDPQASPSVRERYTRFYSLTGLRRLAERRVGTRHADLYQRVRLVLSLLGSDDGEPALGLPALGSFLFSSAALPDLEQADLANHDLLDAIRALAFISDRHGRRMVDYKNLGAEELGSVYESLLELHPELNVDTPQFALASAGGSERKTTGSYYTPSGLISCLLDSALDPVLDAAVREPDPQQALLDLKIVDPACGSGHFLIAAAHRLAQHLAALRSGDEQPAPEATRTALREVIGRCIYGVDSNAMAVELCKVSLWMESLEPGKPLSFLDHHIRCGNSLVGTTQVLVEQGIPNDAYKPVSSDDRAAAAAFRKRNAREHTARERGQAMLPLDFGVTHGLDAAAQAARRLDAMPDASVPAVREKAAAYERLRLDEYDARILCDMWTAAFFLPLVDPNDPTIPTSRNLWDFSERPAAADGRMVGRVAELARQLNFFHWELEFPQVFEPEGKGEKAKGKSEGGDGRVLPSAASGGFDVVLGNPPWERIKLQEQEHFADVPEIANAPNKAARDRRINAWRKGAAYQQARIAQFDAAKYRAEAESRFLRGSGRFPLTAVGDVNTYALFAEHARNLLTPTGRAGIIVPTGIATDDSTKTFFGDLSTQRQLISLFDFENREAIFPGVHRSYKFSLLTMGATTQSIQFLFFATNVAHLSDPARSFSLNPDDISLINPNTRTAPIFRTSQDAELTKKIYRKTPVLIDERQEAKGKRQAGDDDDNPWGVRFMAMFHMANDSHLFRNVPDEGLVPLYEAKLLHQFTHRWATYEGQKGKGKRQNAEAQSRDLNAAELADPTVSITPRYWVPTDAVTERLAGRWERGWLLGFRDITNATNERTAIFSLLPRVGVNHKAPLIMLDFEDTATQTTFFLSCVNSLVFDFVTRQKVGGTNLAFFILKQLPVLPPDRFTPADIAYIVPRVLELVYTAWDIKAFAEDVWEEVKRQKEEGKSVEERAWAEGLLRELMQRNRASQALREPPLAPLPSDPVDPFAFCLVPFTFNEARRAELRAELDARVARLYGLTRDELRYILDPADVYGPDFPGETFRVLKEKEIRLYGEYRTRRLVLEAWDAEEGKR